MSAVSGKCPISAARADNFCGSHLLPLISLSMGFLWRGILSLPVSPGVGIEGMLLEEPWHCRG